MSNIIQAHKYECYFCSKWTSEKDSSELGHLLKGEKAVAHLKCLEDVYLNHPTAFTGFKGLVQSKGVLSANSVKR